MTKKKFGIVKDKLMCSDRPIFKLFFYSVLRAFRTIHFIVTIKEIYKIKIRRHFVHEDTAVCVCSWNCESAHELDAAGCCFVVARR